MKKQRQLIHCLRKLVRQLLTAGLSASDSWVEGHAFLSACEKQVPHCQTYYTAATKKCKLILELLTKSHKTQGPASQQGSTVCKTPVLHINRKTWDLPHALYHPFQVNRYRRHQTMFRLRRKSTAIQAAQIMSHFLCRERSFAPYLPERQYPLVFRCPVFLVASSKSIFKNIDIYSSAFLAWRQALLAQWTVFTFTDFRLVLPVNR